MAKTVKAQWNSVTVRVKYLDARQHLPDCPTAWMPDWPSCSLFGSLAVWLSADVDVTQNITKTIHHGCQVSSQDSLSMPLLFSTWHCPTGYYMYMSLYLADTQLVACCMCCQKAKAPGWWHRDKHVPRTWPQYTPTRIERDEEREEETASEWICLWGLPNWTKLRSISHRLCARWATANKNSKETQHVWVVLVDWQLPLEDGCVKGEEDSTELCFLYIRIHN